MLNVGVAGLGDHMLGPARDGALHIGKAGVAVSLGDAAMEM